MLIAVPLDDRQFEERAKRALEEGADLIELRVDLFENKDPQRVKERAVFVKELGGEAILTVRSEREGGKFVPDRLKIFQEVSPHTAYTDLELSSRELILPVLASVKKGKGRLILSFHDFERTPPRWIIKEVIREALRYGAIPKIAVMARDEGDVLKLLCAGGEIQGDKILISMGQAGKISRLAAFISGSIITYCSLDREVAPGQLSVQEMVKLREIFCK
jgi:3-dehydroquinate dehydratase-1